MRLCSQLCHTTGSVADGWDGIQDDRDILQAVEQELQQRRARLQALEPDAEMQDGEQPMQPAEETPTLLVSIRAVLKTEGRVLVDLHVLSTGLKQAALLPCQQWHILTECVPRPEGAQGAV